MRRKCRGVTEKGRKTKKSRGGVMRRKCRGGVMRRKCRGVTEKGRKTKKSRGGGSNEAKM